MSAKILVACRFESAGEQTSCINQQAPQDIAADSPFREDLWREYRIEAITAGCNASQATEYAVALSPEMGLVGRVSEMAPVGRGWFYKSQTRVVRRTITSGLISLRRRERSQTIGRTAASGAPVFATRFRPWNAGEKS
jgi:hypothetical protein